MTTSNDSQPDATSSGSAPKAPRRRVTRVAAAPSTAPVPLMTATSIFQAPVVPAPVSAPAAQPEQSAPEQTAPVRRSRRATSAAGAPKAQARQSESTPKARAGETRVSEPLELPAVKVELPAAKVDSAKPVADQPVAAEAAPDAERAPNARKTATRKTGARAAQAPLGDLDVLAEVAAMTGKTVAGTGAAEAPARDVPENVTQAVNQVIDLAEVEQVHEAKVAKAGRGKAKRPVADETEQAIAEPAAQAKKADAKKAEPKKSESKRRTRGGQVFSDPRENAPAKAPQRARLATTALLFQAPDLTAPKVAPVAVEIEEEEVVEQEVVLQDASAQEPAPRAERGRGRNGRNSESRGRGRNGSRGRNADQEVAQDADGAEEQDEATEESVLDLVAADLAALDAATADTNASDGDNFDDGSDNDSEATGDDSDSDSDSDDDHEDSAPRRRRRRGGRGRRNRSNSDDDNNDSDDDSDDDNNDSDDANDSGHDSDADNNSDDDSDNDSDDDHGSDGDSDDEEYSSSRRRRRRRRGTRADDDSSSSSSSSSRTRSRSASDEVTALKGSTRLEAKRQRRREGRDAGRRRTIITEAEFLARRESVERSMIVRERDGRTQIAVLEDGVLVEHYVSQQQQASMAGNVYLGRVQNVLPSMEAAFIDVGKGRNAVLYAGEVNWDASGLDGQPRRIEAALKSGDSVLVQVTKDPIGHKGARLTSQVTLAGRYLVYVPGGGMTGISRKLPDTERARLKRILKEIVPEGAGVIVRTAAEGASEEELKSDVARLRAQWESIEKKSKTASAPALLQGEPDLAIRVVRDIFNDAFTSLQVQGNDAWNEISTYVQELAPDLADRVTHWVSEKDIFAQARVDEHLAKGMDRKVWLPSGGSLVIDRTEAMTVIDVNTGKFTGAGGTLEETVTRNNLESAEEIVRQLRLRDIGGIIVIDFIDMVLESNRDLVMRRLIECLGRDRTKHQVAEVTSLGLVQMTRKRVGQGLVEAFSTTCEACNGRGFIVHDEPNEKQGAQGAQNSAPAADSSDPKRSRRKRGQKGHVESETTELVTRLDTDAESREAVKATLATIAAAAVSSHEAADSAPKTGVISTPEVVAAPAAEELVEEVVTEVAAEPVVAEIVVVPAEPAATTPVVTGVAPAWSATESATESAAPAPAVTADEEAPTAPKARAKGRRSAGRAQGKPQTAKVDIMTLEAATAAPVAPVVVTPVAAEASAEVVTEAPKKKVRRAATRAQGATAADATPQGDAPAAKAPAKAKKVTKAAAKDTTKAATKAPAKAKKAPAKDAVAKDTATPAPTED